MKVILGADRDGKQLKEIVKAHLLEIGRASCRERV